MRIRAVVAVGLLQALVGCGGGTSAVDAHAVDGHAIDAKHAPDALVFPDAKVCSLLVAPTTGDVLEMGVAEAAPTPMGGVFADGHYTVSAAVIYTGVGGQAGADGTVYRVADTSIGGTYEFVNAGQSPTFVGSGTYATSGTNDITVTQTCPTMSILGYSKYDASPTTYTIYDFTNPAAVGALTFTMI